MKKSMIKNKLTGLALTLTLLAAATPGFAENRSGAVTISPYVGGYTFDQDSAYRQQRLEISPIFGLRAGYNFTEHWGAEAMFGYVHAESRDANYPEADVYNFGIDGLYHFIPGGSFVPYLAAGVGGSSVVYAAPGLGYYPEYTFNYGGGFKYFVADNVALRGDLRHVFLPDESLNNFVYTAGVTFQFGGVKPAVKTAVVPDCPPPVQAKDTTAPYVTLVVPYNASVGVPLHRIIRASFSEAIDPATINTKTVTIHQGKTAVAGSVLAPNATTASFTQTGNFAPDTLYTGRITTGVKDHAGNGMASDYVWTFKTAPAPDPKVTTKIVTINKFVMLEDTHFEFDKATLTPAGKEMLKQNIKIMKENPDLKVRIAGYTSAAGTPGYNQDLSERRANAVMTYLVEEGDIGPERLDTIGYGATRPAVYEATPSDLESKAAKANMRVLFEVIVK